MSPQQEKVTKYQHRRISAHRPGEDVTTKAEQGTQQVPPSKESSGQGGKNHQNQLLHNYVTMGSNQKLPSTGTHTEKAPDFCGRALTVVGRTHSPHSSCRRLTPDRAPHTRSPKDCGCASDLYGRNVKRCTCCAKEFGDSSKS